MTGSIESDPVVESSQAVTRRVGFYAALLTCIMTIVTFGLAITAIPISGANCLENCIDYPYLNTVERFPQDYRWMLPALLLVLAYFVLMVAIHADAEAPRKIFGQIGLSFATITATILLVDYFVQFSVIPISLMSGETEGITLLTQYNPHGLFIALEDLGYLMMSFSFFFVAFVFTNKNKLETAIRWIFIAAFVLTILSLILFSFSYGLDRRDRFEVAAISINWLALVINGVLLSFLFRRRLQSN